MRKLAFVLMMAASPALAQDGLNFDVEKLCKWQLDNNGMAVEECKKLENEAKAEQAAVETAATPERKAECLTEAKNYSGDSGFASHTVYVQCLKNGPGSL